MTKEPRKLTTQGLTSMAFAFKQSGTLLTAIELDLFSKISQGAHTIPELGKSLDLPSSVADKLVTACTALGLIEKRNSAYYNSPEVDRYLVRGKERFYGDFLLFQARSEYDTWKNMTPALRQPVSPTGLYHTMMQDPEIARGITVAGYNSSIAAGRKLAREFDFSPYSLFLDLGGGSGCYSIPACERHRGLRANVTEVAEEFIAKAGLSDRISTQAGDFSADELPGGADLVGIIGNLHAYSPDETESVIKRAFQAVDPGGSLIVIDYMLNNERTGPLESALRHFESAAYSSKGWVKTPAEISEYMRRAGAIDIQTRDFIPGSLGLVTGKRPQ